MKANLTKPILNCFEDCKGWKYRIARLACNLIILTIIISILTASGSILILVAKG